MYYGSGHMLLGFVAGFPQRGRNVPTKPRSRSVPDVAVLNSPNPCGFAH